VFSTPKFVRIYVFFKKIMGSTRSHPLPPGIFVKMPSPPLARSQPISAWYNEAETIVAPSEFDDWTEKDFDDEIKRLQKRVKELETEKIKKRVDRALVWDDDDDIMNDPDVRKMVENGEHICHMFDGECRACQHEEDEEEYDGEVRVLTEEEVENDPEMTAQLYKDEHSRAHFC
jgi:hypothetical protein